MDDAKQKMQNKVVLDSLSSADPSMRKEAQENLTDYIRVKARESGVVRNIFTPITVTPADLDIQAGFEEPAIVLEKEPDTPNAVTVPFGGSTTAREIEGDRYLVVFDTIQTLKKRKSKFLLMTYKNDLRQIITDLDLNEVLEHEDRRFFTLIDQQLGGSADTSLSAAGNVALWQTVGGGLTPESWVDCMQIMPKADGHFVPTTVVMNMVRAMELESWNADAMGTSWKEEVFQNGLSVQKLFGRKLIITNKRDIVGDNEIYMFAEENKLGRFCVLQDATIYPDAEGQMIEWYCLESIGCTLAQVTGVAKATLSD